MGLNVSEYTGEEPTWRGAPPDGETGELVAIVKALKDGEVKSIDGISDKKEIERLKVKLRNISDRTKVKLQIRWWDNRILFKKADSTPRTVVEVERREPTPTPPIKRAAKKATTTTVKAEK